MKTRQLQKSGNMPELNHGEGSVSFAPPCVPYLQHPFRVRHRTAHNEAAESDVRPRLREDHRLGHVDLGLAGKVLVRDVAPELVREALGLHAGRGVGVEAAGNHLKGLNKRGLSTKGG